MSTTRRLWFRAWFRNIEKACSMLSPSRSAIIPLRGAAELLVEYLHFDSGSMLQNSDGGDVGEGLSGVVESRVVIEQALVDAATSLGPVTFGALGLEGYVEMVRRDGEPDITTVPNAHLEVQFDRLTSGNIAYDAELRRHINARRFPTAYVDLLHASRLEATPPMYLVDRELTLSGVTVPGGTPLSSLDAPRGRSGSPLKEPFRPNIG